METVAKRATQRHTGASFSWHRQTSSGPSYGSNVCRYWLAGNCLRNPCRFAHPDIKTQSHARIKVENAEFSDLKRIKKRSSENEVEVSDYGKQRGNLYRLDSTAPTKRVVRLNRSVFGKSQNSPRQLNDNLTVEKKECKELKNSPVMECRDVDSTEVGSKDGLDGSFNVTNSNLKEVRYTKICEDWVNRSCFNGEDCKFLHSWCYGDGFSMLAQLDGHKKAVTGITLPLGSDKLFSGSKDGTVRVWCCHTGECVGVADVGAPVECLISEGPGIFVGLSSIVKVWNVQTNAEFTLTSQAGQVHAMVAARGILFAGVHDGSILAWKINSETTSFDDMTPLKGHTNVVVSLIVGDKVGHKLYSGSLDNTIRVWDLETMQCIYTLAKHSDMVTSLLCWEEYVLSCSMDHTLKVWASTEAGGLEVTYEHNEEHGILALCVMHDAANKPVLICSCDDNTIRLYELPSFVERGRIFAKKEARAIQLGPSGLFFTGDGTGLVSVWKCSSNSTAASDKAT